MQLVLKICLVIVICGVCTSAKTSEIVDRDHQSHRAASSSKGKKGAGGKKGKGGDSMMGRNLQKCSFANPSVALAK